MSEKRIDSSFLDKAIIYATKAHQNVERREKGFPYIVHPLESMSIVATLTNDQEVLATFGFLLSELLKESTLQYLNPILHDDK